MGCNCGKKNATSFQVITADGKVAFSSTVESTARSVARRYPGSKVEPKQPAAAKKAAS